jgi:hypothetical protein
VPTRTLLVASYMHAVGYTLEFCPIRCKFPYTPRFTLMNSLPRTLSSRLRIAVQRALCRGSAASHRYPSQPPRLLPQAKNCSANEIRRLGFVPHQGCHMHVAQAQAGHKVTNATHSQSKFHPAFKYPYVTFSLRESARASKQAGTLYPTISNPLPHRSHRPKIHKSARTFKNRIDPRYASHTIQSPHQKKTPVPRISDPTHVHP